MVFSWISGAGSPGIPTEYSGREGDKTLFKQAVSATRTNHAEMKAKIELTRASGPAAKVAGTTRASSTQWCKSGHHLLQLYRQRLRFGARAIHTATFHGDYSGNNDVWGACAGPQTISAGAVNQWDSAGTAPFSQARSIVQLGA